MQTLGEMLCTAREQMGLTLRQVEESTGVSNAYLSQLETGKIKKPSANVLYKLATLYKLSLEGLFRASQIITATEAPLVNLTAIGPYMVTSEEEAELIEFLGYLRFKNKHKR